MNPKNGTPNTTNNHTPDQQPLSPATLGLVILVLAIAVGVVIWNNQQQPATPAENYTQTSFENFSGVQGIVAYVDYANQRFITERRTLTEHDDGTFTSNRSIFNFNWNDDTAFLYYRNGAALNADQAWEVDHTYLTDTRTVIVTTRENPEPDAELTATEIKILPNFSAPQE